MSTRNVSFLLGLTFFFLALVTLPHYGINWDTINHLPRGQAYLHYFLTGKKDYSDLPVYFHDWDNPNEWYSQNPKNLFIDTNLAKKDVPTRSLYQTDWADYTYFVDGVGGGHPPISDILSSIFNRVLFGKLRLINDIDSYRVYGILLAAGLVGLVYFWVTKKYSSVAGFFSAVSLATYPLFWSEAHFNTEKDIPETVLWSIFLYCVWRGVTQKNYKWILFSGVFFGLALGTKFNILFSIFIVVPWLIFLLVYKYLKLSQLPKLILSGLSAVVLGLFMVFVSWPYLWKNPIVQTKNVISFYQDIGTGDPIGINAYPIVWILATTPEVILLLSFIGIVYCGHRVIRYKDELCLLFLLWLVVPIARFMWPGASFYGGARQIMEYIPALAILSGLGANVIYAKIKHKKIALTILACLFIPLISKLVAIHPNENVYFNSLIGGLYGAKQKDLPYWGFSLGNPYRQGVVWLNDHAEMGAKVAYVYELIPNFPRIWLRPDIILDNKFRSGNQQKGEYAITLTYQGVGKRSEYETYLNEFVQPVFEVKVDNVSILTIWKNDKDHLVVPWCKL